MPTGGCTERLLSKYLQNIVPQFLTESAAYVGINRHLDGWMASWLRTRILFTYYSSSTQASIVFSEFYLNVIQIELQKNSEALFLMYRLKIKITVYEKMHVKRKLYLLKNNKRTTQK